MSTHFGDHDAVGGEVIEGVPYCRSRFELASPRNRDIS
jgi:hypothetical protein